MGPERIDSGAEETASSDENPAAFGLGKGRPKILGIGLSRTGTTSLTAALNRLGFPALHYPTRLSQIEAHAAVTDITVSMAFQGLDRMFPGSCFIMTLRALEPWLKSCEQLWQKNAAFFNRNPMVKSIERKFYGGDGFERERFVAAYHRHLAAVETYFRDRPGDILYLDLFETADPWQPLCRFLKVPVPSEPFPHQNRSAAADRVLTRLLGEIGDVEEVARLTLVDVDYLQGLLGANVAHAASISIMLDGGFEERRILRQCGAELGTRRLAELLKIDEDALKAYIGRRA
ncbi:MAG: hypothetical protein Kow00114_14150 [Kiloniellaceae bacterium]